MRVAKFSSELISEFCRYFSQDLLLTAKPRGTLASIFDTRCTLANRSGNRGASLRLTEGKPERRIRVVKDAVTRSRRSFQPVSLLLEPVHMGNLVIKEDSEMQVSQAAESLFKGCHKTDLRSETLPQATPS